MNTAWNTRVLALPLPCPNSHNEQMMPFVSFPVIPQLTTSNEFRVCFAFRRRLIYIFLPAIKLGLHEDNQENVKLPVQISLNKSRRFLISLYQVLLEKLPVNPSHSWLFPQVHLQPRCSQNIKKYFPPRMHIWHADLGELGIRQR